MDQKTRANYSYLKETHFKYNGTNILKVNRWRKIYHENTNPKKVGVAISISDKVNFKVKNVSWDKGGCYKIIKESILQGDITTLNMCM